MGTNSALSFLTRPRHTVDSVRASLYAECIQNPGTTLDSLFRGLAVNVGAKDDATATEIFRVLADTKADTMIGDIPFGVLRDAMLAMCAGNMSGEVSANQAEAKALADKILFKLMAEPGKRMKKDDMSAAVLPGINLELAPQQKADFRAALVILNGDKNVIRRTSKGDIAEKKWDTMEYAAPVKPVQAKAKPAQ